MTLTRGKRKEEHAKGHMVLRSGWTNLMHVARDAHPGWRGRGVYTGGASSSHGRQDVTHRGRGYRIPIGPTGTWVMPNGTDVQKHVRQVHHKSFSRLVLGDSFLLIVSASHGRRFYSGFNFVLPRHGQCPGRECMLGKFGDGGSSCLVAGRR
jgi:hypothetical protein